MLPPCHRALHVVQSVSAVSIKVPQSWKQPRYFWLSGRVWITSRTAGNGDQPRSATKARGEVYWCICGPGAKVHYLPMAVTEQNHLALAGHVLCYKVINLLWKQSFQFWLEKKKLSSWCVVYSCYLNTTALLGNPPNNLGFLPAARVSSLHICNSGFSVFRF